MATNLAIDDHLIEAARKIGGHRTKKATVTEALVEYIRAPETGKDSWNFWQGRLRSRIRLQEAAPAGMNVLVDTSVWSLALRRTGSIHPSRSELERLILDGRVAIIGPIRQEILSGVKIAAQFHQVRNQLKAFPDAVLATEDFEEAASFFNTCRARGIQGSNTDFLICAAAVRRKMPIFTTDGDFQHYAKVLPITLH